jgi:hypothetical protein
MKKNCVSIALFSIVLVFSVIISSCSNSGTEPESTKINISGKVSAQLNIPVSNAIVKVNDKVTTTSINGDFSLNDITTPYDLKIIDTTNKRGFIFKGLSRSTFNIILPYLPQTQNGTDVIISYPSGIFTSGGKAIFTDGNQMSYYKNLDSNSTYLTTYPGNSTSITGKIILIFYTKDNSGNIISYDRYGEKDGITINAGVTKNVDFSLNDLQLNPGEVTVSGSFSGLQGFSTNKYFYLNFGKRHNSNFLNYMWFIEFQEDIFNIVLPTNLPSDYTPLIFVIGQGTYPNGSIWEQFTLPKSGTGINLSLHDWPTLINPSNNATNIDSTTLFEWTTGTGNGIYSIDITDPVSKVEYRIYTNIASTTLSDLYSLGLGNISNRTFEWYCEKSGSVSSLDEYLDPERNNLGYFKATTTSRSFNTKP